MLFGFPCTVTWIDILKKKSEHLNWHFDNCLDSYWSCQFMEIVFCFQMSISNLNPLWVASDNIWGSPPKCLLVVRLYLEQFTHFLVHNSIVQVTSAKYVPLIMVYHWIWGFFSLSLWAEAMTCSMIQFFWWAWHHFNTSDMRASQTYFRLVQWLCCHILFLGCSLRQQEHRTHLSSWW